MLFRAFYVAAGLVPQRCRKPYVLQRANKCLSAGYFDLGQKETVFIQNMLVFLCCVRKQSYLCIVKTKQ